MQLGIQRGCAACLGFGGKFVVDPSAPGRSGAAFRGSAFYQLERLEVGGYPSYVQNFQPNSYLRTTP